MAKLTRPIETSRRIRYSGRIFRVATCDLRWRDGRRATHEVVLHDGAAVFAPITARGGVLLVRQYRHAARRFLWEIPAGRLERGESPLACAKRELAEECGLAARRWEKVATFLPAPGYTTEPMHLFFARGLRPAPPGATPDDDEEFELREFSLPELERAIRGGRIVDAKTIVAAYRLRRR
ncbi:MAG TPA: NUDIX hydrolase [Planctomycetota bacterium]|nr:NUDIX hydrolase [Planctomycetota bacterium]